ncbi:hypothetical protein AALA00_06145 [Lachnospiraceae bacterium 46-15]
MAKKYGISKKNRQKKEKTITPFDKMLNEVAGAYTAGKYLEECMKFPLDAAQRIPLRYRLIALGFVKGSSLEEVNEKLLESGCERLYARNMWEAGLIYAFLHGISCSRWQELQKICEDVRREQEQKEKWFRNREIRLEDLEEYLRENSMSSAERQITSYMTRQMEQKLAELEGDEEEFRKFLMENLECFSRVREKARYYFCKYLYRYLCQRIEDAALEVERGFDKSAIFREMKMFKVTSVLQRKTMDAGKVRKILNNAAISSGGVFRAFDEFYFGYVTMEWMDVLLEYYGNIEGLSEDEREELAAALRAYDSSYQGKSDEEVLAEAMAEIEKRERELDEGKKGTYQSGRSGENAVRSYMKGGLDIDRTTFLCFLLFFAQGTKLPPEEAMRKERLNHMLLECGFPVLDKKQDFDSFVLHYMDAENPEDYLMEEVTRYAQMEQNFYLYKTFRASRSMDREWEKRLQPSQDPFPLSSRESPGEDARFPRGLPV